MLTFKPKVIYQSLCFFASGKRCKVPWFVIHFEGISQHTLDHWTPEDFMYMVVLTFGAHVF